MQPIDKINKCAWKYHGSWVAIIATIWSFLESPPSVALNSRSSLKVKKTHRERYIRNFWKMDLRLHATPSRYYSLCVPGKMQCAFHSGVDEWSRELRAHASTLAEQTPGHNGSQLRAPLAATWNWDKSRERRRAPAARSHDTIARIPLDQCIKNWRRSFNSTLDFTFAPRFGFPLTNLWLVTASIVKILLLPVKNISSIISSRTDDDLARREIFYNKKLY